MADPVKRPRGPKERVYDSTVRGLVEEVGRRLKAAGCNFVMEVSLDTHEDGGTLFATSYAICDVADPAVNYMLELARAVSPKGGDLKTDAEVVEDVSATVDKAKAESN